MIGDVCEWLGAHPSVSLALLVCFGLGYAAVLVACSRWRSPLPIEAMHNAVPIYPRRRQWRDRDEHADHLGIG